MPVFYDCKRCTACCRWPGQVRLTEPEILRIADHLGLTDHEFIQRHTESQERGIDAVERPGGGTTRERPSS